MCLAASAGLRRLRKVYHFQGETTFLVHATIVPNRHPFFQQMRVIHDVAFTDEEVESYRQLVYDNITRGMKLLLDAMADMEMKVTVENLEHFDWVDGGVPELKGGEVFPMETYGHLKALWADRNVKIAYERGNEAALPEK